MSFPSFLKRLKQRKVVQWALAFGAGAVVVVQLLDALAEPFGLSPAAQRVILLLLGFGFLATLVLAWYHGEKGRQSVSSPELLILFVLLLAAGFSVSKLSSWGEVRKPTGTDAIMTPDDGAVRIALLPLDDLSPSPEDAYFADGVHEELMDRLSQISSLEVISRSSVERYRVRGERPPVSEIAEALGGVDFILEGSARVGSGQVRITVQLIDARTDRHVWSGPFDSPYAVEDFILLQSELARRITSELEIEIAPEEQARIGVLPTNNEGAYQFYLKARAVQDRVGVNWDTLATAIDFLEEAIRLDPTFALAHATLSQLHGEFYYLGPDHSESRLAAQRTAAEEALRLQPDLPQTRFAIGYLYYVTKDYRKALEEFNRCLDGMPNESRARHFVAMAHRRLGDWEEALSSARQAIDLDPDRAAWHGDILGLTLWATHQYAEASIAQSRALSLEPERWGAARAKGMIHLAWEGQLDTLREGLRRTPGVPLQYQVQLRLLEREPDSALALLRGIPNRWWPDDIYLIRAQSELSGWAHKMKGEDGAATAAFDSARVILEAYGKEHPDDPRVQGGLGFAYAGLGRTADAIRAANRLAEANRRYPFEWAEMGHTVAQILAQAGAVGQTIEVLEPLLAGPSYISVNTVDTDWAYDPVRNDPRFQALLEKYRNKGSS